MTKRNRTECIRAICNRMECTGTERTSTEGTTSERRMTERTAAEGTTSEHKRTERTTAERTAPGRANEHRPYRSARKALAGLTAALMLLSVLPAGGWTEQVFAASPAPAAGYPLINLTIDESRGTIRAMNSDVNHNTKCYGTMELTIPESMAETGGYEAKITAEMEIKGRGNSTWNMQKKPYQIKLTSKENPFGMGKHKTWILLQNHADKTLIRNKLMYELADALNMPYSPKSEFAEVCMNGEYLGTYQLSEKTQIGTNRIEIDDLEDEPDARQEPKITGGYLLEQDREDRAIVEPMWFKAKSGNYFVMKSPETANSSQKAYITNYMNDLEAAIMSSSFCNSKGQRYDNLIDLDSLVNYLIVQELAKNYDAGGSGTTSVYMYKPRNDVMYMGPVWDFDLSVGNYHVSGSQDPKNWMIINSGWYAYLQKDRVFMEALQAKWNEIQPLLKSLYDDSGQEKSRITELTNYVKGMNNWTRWTFSEQIVTWSGSAVQKDYNAEVEKLRSFVKDRVAWINANMASKTAASNRTTAIGGTVGITGAAIGGTAAMGVDLSKLRPQAAWDSLSVQWLRDGQPIEGAVQSTYRSAEGDEEHQITVKVTGAGSYTGSRESSAACPLTVVTGTGGEPIQSSGVYGPGQKLTVSAAALPGYRFSEWSGKNISIEDRWAAQTTVTMPESGAAELRAAFKQVSSCSYESLLRLRDQAGYECAEISPDDVLTLELSMAERSEAPKGIRLLEERIKIDTSVFDVGAVTPASDAVLVQRKDGEEKDTAVFQILYYNPDASGDRNGVELADIALTVRKDVAEGTTLIHQEVVGLSDGEGNQPDRSQIAADPEEVKIVRIIPEDVLLIQPDEQTQNVPHILGLLAGAAGYGSENTILQVKRTLTQGRALAFQDGGNHYPLYHSSVLDAWIGVIPRGDMSYGQADRGLVEEDGADREIRYGLVGDGRDGRIAVDFEDLYYFDRTALVQGTVPPGDEERVLAMDMNGDYYLTPTDLVKLIRVWLEN